MTTIDTITTSSNRELVRYAHGVWRMNAQGGADFGELSRVAPRMPDVRMLFKFLESVNH